MPIPSIKLAINAINTNIMILYLFSQKDLNFKKYHYLKHNLISINSYK